MAFGVSSRRVFYLYTLVQSFISMFNVYDLRLVRALTVDFIAIDHFGKLLRKELKIDPVPCYKEAMIFKNLKYCFAIVLFKIKSMRALFTEPMPKRVLN